MSNARGTAATVGFVAGLAMGFRDYRRDIDRDVHFNRETSADALELGQDNQSRLNQMLANGDFKRLADNHVSDLMVGLSFPDQSAPVAPSAFASLPAVLPLPDLTEALAVAPSVWPGPTNTYNEDGTLSAPGAAFVGQNVATGVALGNPSVRAALLGMTETTQPTANKLAQLHRMFRGLVLSLGQYELAPLTLAQFRAMWLTLLGPSGPGPAVVPSGILWSQVSNGPLLNTFTAEAVLLTVPIPAGSLQIGGAVEVQCTGVSALASGNVTFRARLDTITGTPFIVTPADTNSSDVFDLRVQLARGADAGGLGTFVVSPAWKLAPGAGSSGTPGVANTASFDPSIVHYIVFTATCSVAALGNTAQAQVGLTRKL